MESILIPQNGVEGKDVVQTMVLPIPCRLLTGAECKSKQPTEMVWVLNGTHYYIVYIMKS